MLKNYFIVAYRNLLKNKTYSAINIFGLALGMAACFFIFQYVRFELSYDRFHKNANRIYRVPISYTGSLATARSSIVNHPAVGPAMKNDFPEVVDYVRLAPPNIFMRTSTLVYDDSKGNIKRFNEKKFFLADKSFFRIFSFPFIYGDAVSSLSKPNSIVLSQTTARKYFGDIDPLGKTLSMNNELLNVTGVFKDIPDNSHVKFDLLISFNTVGENWGFDIWRWPEFYNYILVSPDADIKSMEKRLPAFAEKYLGDIFKELDFKSWFVLQPLTDIHLKSNMRNELDVNGSERTVYFLLALGIFILVIAWINYINLSTAKSMERAREVGMRKVVGASRKQLAFQFILESFIINCIALLVAVVIVVASSGWFDDFVGKKLTTTFLESGMYSSWKFWIILVLVFVLGAIQVGVYPAFILSSFRPVAVLKGKLHQSVTGIAVRKGLVGFQFFLAIILITGSIIMYRQLSYMRNQDLGYNKDQVLIVKSPALTDSLYDVKVSAFKKELLKNSSVINVCASSEIPGKNIFSRNSMRKISDVATTNFMAKFVDIDNDFLPTYQIKLAAGRNFANRNPGDIYKEKKAELLVNEELVKGLGYKSNDDAVGKFVYFHTNVGDILGEIIGVIKNYHQQSLKEQYTPILYFYTIPGDWAYFSINVQKGNISKTIASINNEYSKLFPGNAFESFFLDEFFNQQYIADERFGDVFGLFTSFAIVVACIGLIGLSTFSTKLRTKEIGIRKVLGASAGEIVYLFYKDFMRLVLIASVIAVPVIYLTANKWLENFAFRIELSWMMFAFAVLVLMVLALLTIAFQSLKAALANPIKSLRND